MTSNRPSQRAIDHLLTALHRLLGVGLRTDAEALAIAGQDASDFRTDHALGVAFPKCTDEVVAVAKACSEDGIPMVPRGAGTGKAGGAVPAVPALVVDLSNMNRVIQAAASDLYIDVEPGLVTHTLDHEAKEMGMMFPPDPSSWVASTIGGNIATNAGGPRALKYGSTGRYVWGLQSVLPNGNVIETGRRCLKGVAGYDLTSLVVGSEGTLGFITQATLHVLPSPERVCTAWLGFASVQDANIAAEKVFATGLIPRTLELLDHEALSATTSVGQFNMTDRVRAALLVETDGTDQAAEAEMVRLSQAAMDTGGVSSAVATNQRDADAMQHARRDVSPSLKRAFPYKISDDVALPRSRMGEFCKHVHDAAGAFNLKAATYGHLGDGNLHLNLLASTPDERTRAVQLRDSLLKNVVSWRGTITAEHGLGATKRNDLSREQSEFVIELQRQLKRTFDPDGLCNPKKLFPDRFDS